MRAGREHTRRLTSFSIGFGLSALGQSMGTVVVLVLVHDRTDSMAWLAVAAAARLLPYLVISPLAGVLADTADRRRLFLGAHQSRAVLALALAAAAATGAPVAVLILLSFALTACGTPCFPVALAALPAVAGGDDPARATAVISTVETAAFLAGPALGGLVLAATAPSPALVANAAVFALAILFVPADMGEPPERSGRASRRALATELRDGARMVARSAPIRVSVAACVVVNVIAGMVSVLVVPMATEQLGGGSSGAGLLAAAFGGGGLIGAGLAAWRTSWSPAGSLLLAGAPVALAARTGRPGLVWLLLLVAGGAAAMFEVLMIARIRRITPDAMVARVFGLFDATVVGAVVVGAALAPTAVAALGLTGALVATGLALPLPALYALRTAPAPSLRSPA